MSAIVSIVLDGKGVACEAGDRILDVARREGVYIPTLCHDPRLEPFGACRVCLVGVAGARGPVPACTTVVRDGMIVDTKDPLATRVARGVVELVLSDHPPEALARGGERNELAQVARHFGLTRSRYTGERHAHARDDRHPYLKLDLAECIVCGRCVRACDEVQGNFALSMAGRGFDAHPVAGLDAGFDGSGCPSCGACASACPTGAIDEAAFREGLLPDRTVRTTCAYCGTGCTLEVLASGDRVLAVEPALDGPVNRGHACVKGRFAHGFARASDRLTQPLLRGSDGLLHEASWDVAMSFVAGKLADIKRRHGPDAIAAIASSRCTNEENFLFMKVVRAAIGTNNIDNCARVCHAPSSFGLIQAFGQSGGTNSFDDIERAGCLLVAGANPTEAHPVVGARLKQATLAGAKLLVIDPRRIELARLADVFLQLRPGSNVAVFNGLAHLILRDGLADRAFLARHAQGLEALEAHLASYDPASVERISGVPERELARAAQLYAGHAPAAIFYGLGITEQRQGSAGVQALANLAILTGNIGRPGAGVNPLRGQNNVQGASDVGTLPDMLTLYRKVTDGATRAVFEERWGVALPPRPGYRIPQMLDAAVAGSLKALWCFGEDIAHTEPNTRHVEEALRALELLVVQDLFPNATSAFAHAVLPGASFLEKTGTFTNAERRIQLVNAAVPPPAGARQDSAILAELSRRLGYDLGEPTPAALMDELASLSPGLAGVSHARLGRTGLQWPVPTPEHPGTPLLYADGRFDTPSGKAQLAAAAWNPPGETPDEAFPLVLITGRQLMHYNSGTMTRRTANVTLHPRDCVEIAPRDAERLGLAEGDLVEVASRRATIRAHAIVTDRVAAGQVFLSFHFPEQGTNRLTSASSDEVTNCPEYKVTAVSLAKVRSHSLG
jgi:formate dehydrogenase major subunit